MSENAAILLVDDDPIMREVGASKLLDAGYAVETAENGRIALDLTRRRDFDLIISDVDMPEVTGYELTRTLRETPAFAAKPIIVITGSSGEDAAERAFAAGATSFLSKPMNWALFGHAVKFALRASENEKALRVARDQAESGLRFKDNLMSVMSHELRTPLNAIIGFGQILGEQFEKENDIVHREYADYIVDGGRRLLNSVSDMLLASDARSGPISINETDCALEEMIDLAVSPLRKLAEASGAEIKISLHDPDTELCCDRQLVARAIGKLVENSIKFSAKGVRIVIGTGLSKGGDVIILVRDDGPGISPDKLRDAMQAFTQTDMSLRRSKEGLGLGLPLVNAIAAAHGAKFKVDSKPGKGASAFIVIPADRVAQKRSAGAGDANGGTQRVA